MGWSKGSVPVRLAINIELDDIADIISAVTGYDYEVELDGDQIIAYGKTDARSYYSPPVYYDNNMEGHPAEYDFEDDFPLDKLREKLKPLKIFDVDIKEEDFEPDEVGT